VHRKTFDLSVTIWQPKENNTKNQNPSLNKDKWKSGTITAKSHKNIQTELINDLTAKSK